VLHRPRIAQVPSGARSAVPLGPGRFRDVDDLSLTMSRITTDDPDLLGRGGRQHLPPKGEKCYPCVRYGLSPFSQDAQTGQSEFVVCLDVVATLPKTFLS
jgi:hypothetical protein